LSSTAENGNIVSEELSIKANYLLKFFMTKFDSAKITSAIIATTDGFEIAVVAASKEESSKLSAISSSISAIGDMAVKEVDMGECHESITIESDRGYIVIMTIPHPDSPMVLSVAATKELTLGKLVYYAKLVVSKMIRA
jgi:predicted regulator of Ras-like GTPase activity (Roadblock/LC7/MglB family)